MSISYGRPMARDDEGVDWPRAPRRRATDDEARALASTVRMRILRICLDEACSNKEIAGILGRDPASTLHHVRRLVETGFLAAQPARRGARGAREIPYLATGKSWRMSTPAADRVLVDAFLEEVGLVALEEVETIRLGLTLSPDRLRGLMDRFVALLDEFRADAADPAARPMSLFLAIHPDPNRPAGGSA
jgi:predicted transcriptional regulator